MGALTCDICGGRLKIGKGKIAICENCGMEHSVERVREKIQEVKGTVHVDSAHLIENFLSMAQDAFSTENYAEAENYCNKVLENDSLHVEALFLKGKAVGWQSSLSNFRFNEAAKCFANAIISIGNDDLKKSLNDEIQDEYRKLSTALVTTRCNRFKKLPDKEETNGFCNDLLEITNAIDMYITRTGMTINRNNVFSNVTLIVQSSVSVAVTKIVLPEYEIDGSRSAYNTFVERIDNCVQILEKTSDLCDDDDSSDIQIYEFIINMLEAVIRCNKSDFISDKWGAFKNIPRLSDYEVHKRQMKINELKNKIIMIKRGL